MQSLLPFHSGAKAETDIQFISLSYKKISLKNHMKYIGSLLRKLARGCDRYINMLPCKRVS